MAKPQEKTVNFLMTPCSSVTEHPIENDDDSDDVHHNYLDEYDRDTFLCNGCSCFRFFPFNLRRSRDESSYNLLNQKTEHNRESWFVTKLKKMREVSEKLAGPKWKNLVRKIGGYLKKKHKIKPKNKSGRFQYSPQSYALNFEDSDDDDDDDVGFSSRFAPPPSNSKANPNSNPNPNSIVDDD